MTVSAPLRVAFAEGRAVEHDIDCDQVANQRYIPRELKAEGRAAPAFFRCLPKRQEESVRNLYIRICERLRIDAVGG